MQQLSNPVINILYWVRMIHKIINETDSVILCCLDQQSQSVRGPVVMNGDEMCHVFCSKCW